MSIVAWIVKRASHTFSEDGQVDLNYLAIEAEDGLQVLLYDVPREVGDDNNFCVRLVHTFTVGLHVDVGIVQRVWGGRASTGRHRWQMENP